MENNYDLASATKYCLLFICLVSLSGCLGSKYGQKNKSEKVVMERTESPDVIDYAKLIGQPVPTLASRGIKSRGVATALTGTMIGMGVSAVKQLITKEKDRYKAEWKSGLSSLYFYDQLSTQGAFDPVGMQFSGFNIKRNFTDKDGQVKQAFRASFELDTANIYEIFNNATFRLRLKDLELDFSKAKIPRGRNKLNVDVEITFNTSYIGIDGTLFKDVELGKFYLRLRNAPLDKKDPEYAAYYEKLRNSPIEGQSFIVPRSYGYHLVNRNRMEPSWSQGAYSIAVKVTESSKNTFTNQLIMDTSGSVIEIESKHVNDIINKKLN